MRKKTGKENFRKRKERSKERQTEKRMIKNEIIIEEGTTHEYPERMRFVA